MSDIDSNVEQAKGKLKEAAGDLTDNDDLKREGKVEHASGTVKGKLDEAKDKAEDVIDRVKDKVTGDR